MAERNKFPKGNNYGKRIESGADAAQKGRAGGLKAQANLRAKRSVQEQARAMWETIMTNKKGEQKEMGEIALAQLAVKCMGGDLKAIKLFVQLMGEFLVKNEVTGKDGAPLLPESKEDLMKELERLREATR